MFKSVLTWNVFISKSDVENIDAGLVGAVVDGVLPVFGFVTFNVRPVRALEDHAETTVS